MNPTESEDAMRATVERLQICFFGLFQNLQVCTDLKCKFCWNIVDIQNGEEMIRYKNASKWDEKELPDGMYMSDEGAGHKAYVTKERPKSMLLKCYQHCGSEWRLILYLISFILLTMLINVVAVAFDKRAHRKMFTGEVEFERYYRYLWYASLNTFMHLVDVFMDKMIKLLEEDDQEDAADDEGGGTLDVCAFRSGIVEYELCIGGLLDNVEGGGVRACQKGRG